MATSTEHSSIGTCPFCEKKIPSDQSYRFCPYCGSGVLPTFGEGDAGAIYTGQEIDDFLISLDNRLYKTSADISDRAFNLSCGLGLLLLIFWSVGVYFVGGRNWLLLIIAIIVFSLAVLWIVILVTDISRNQAMKRVYRDEIRPDLEAYSEKNQVEVEAIEAEAHRTLADQAPLLKFLPAPPPEEEDDDEN